MVKEKDKAFEKYKGSVFTIKEELIVDARQSHILEARLKTLGKCRNAYLSILLTRADQMRADPYWVKIAKVKDPATKASAYKAIKEQYGYPTMQSKAINLGLKLVWHDSNWIAQVLEAAVVQTAFIEVYTSVNQWLYGKRGRPHYQGAHKLDTVKNYKLKTGLTLNPDQTMIIWKQAGQRIALPSNCKTSGRKDLYLPNTLE